LPAVHRSLPLPKSTAPHRIDPCEKSRLGFIHEDSGQAFVLDIADLYRHDVTLEIAFGAIQESLKSKEPFERLVRRRAAKLLRQHAVIPSMIDKIKTLLHLDAAPLAEKEPLD